MAMIECKECKTQVSSTAKICPKCGHANPKANYLSGKQVFGGLLLAGVGIWWASTGSDVYVSSQLKTVHSKVADDFVSKYQIAKREGDKMQVCVQAGFVSAAYLQAKDEANYQQWKQTEKADCRKAGINRP